MVYKVLSAIVGSLLGVMSFLFVASLVYTLAQPQVMSGVAQIRTGIEGLVDAATEEMDDGWSLELPSLSVLSPETSGSQASSEPLQDGAAESSASAVPKSAYLSWKETLGSPEEKVADEAGIDSAVIEGVAAGSPSAIEALLASGDEPLAALGAAGAVYAASVEANVVPTGLPDPVRIQMVQANIAAQEYGTAMADVAQAAGRLRGGDAAAQADLVEAASRAVLACEACLSFVRAADSLQTS